MLRRTCLCLTLLLAASAAHAERLPIKTYSTSDGLAHDTINCIVQDSAGFLWFCTDGGLSRFDGCRFTSDTTADGLPSNQVGDLIQTRDGTYWIATQRRSRPFRSERPQDAQRGKRRAGVVDDAATPAPGQASWYLVRAVGCGGVGSYDEQPPLPSGSRDAEIAAAPGSCP